MDFYIVEIAGSILDIQFTSLGDVIQFCIENTNTNCSSYVYEAVLAADGATEKLGLVLKYTND